MLTSCLYVLIVGFLTYLYFFSPCPFVRLLTYYLFLVWCCWGAKYLKHLWGLAASTDCIHFTLFRKRKMLQFMVWDNWGPQDSSILFLFIFSDFLMCLCRASSFPSHIHNFYLADFSASVQSSLFTPFLEWWPQTDSRHALLTLTFALTGEFLFFSFVVREE